MDIQRKSSDIRRRGQEKTARINQAKQDLANLESQAGQQNTKLLRISRDTARAWEWIQQHRDEFEKPVFGPPVVECSVKDPKYADAMESLLQKNDSLAITVQTKNDFKKMTEKLDVLKLAEINIRTMPVGLENYPPPMDEQNMRHYGFEGWAIDYITGPEPVLAMLCQTLRLHQTGISWQDTSNEAYERIQASSIGRWVTSKSIYQINRRREYGAGAVSTSVKGLRKAQYWTNQPVDISAKRDLQENIDGWAEELTALSAQLKEAAEEMDRLKEEKGIAEQESVIFP